MPAPARPLTDDARRKLRGRVRALERAEIALEGQRGLLACEVARARDAGASFRAIAEVLGVSKQRVMQLDAQARAEVAR